jgi:Tfp pilus assembly protein PilF
MNRNPIQSRARQRLQGFVCMNRHVYRLSAIVLVLLIGLFLQVQPQAGGNRSIFGDLKVDESQVSGLKAISFDVILCNEGGMRVNHQTVSPNGRYRFFVTSGVYDIVVELEQVEVARVRVEMRSPLVTTYQKDIELIWRAKPGSERKVRAGTLSPADLYERTPATDKLFSRAEQAFDRKDYDQAVLYFQEILKVDSRDYQSWTELGTVYLTQKKPIEAEKAYARAIEIQPAYLLALVDLGRLRLALKNYDGAIEILNRAVTAKPDSPDANMLLGEAFLQIRKGSKAVGYLSEALRLDPIGMAEAHLRLALLYNGAGMKDKAALEYEQFLKKKPNYPERKKLEQYIAANKKP